MGVRVLIVDDERLVRCLLRDLFEDAGYEVHEAEDWHGVRDLVPETDVDVVVLDVSLPGLSGPRIAGFLRGALHPAPRVLLHSGMEPRALRDLSRQIGAHGFLPKGSSNKALLRAVEDAARSRHAEPLRPISAPPPRHPTTSAPPDSRASTLTRPVGPPERLAGARCAPHERIRVAFLGTHRPGTERTARYLEGEGMRVYLHRGLPELEVSLGLVPVDVVVLDPAAVPCRPEDLQVVLRHCGRKPRLVIRADAPEGEAEALSRGYQADARCSPDDGNVALALLVRRLLAEVSSAALDRAGV